jgi:hypothetical protein
MAGVLYGDTNVRSNTRADADVLNHLVATLGKFSYELIREYGKSSPWSASPIGLEEERDAL